ncbi:hypothetical protein L1267_17965 [Pseudoalteromonas sp. OFAV1]|uniref:hypothetical protein n=1 Tax=Pseudoalteromonas sp. OFAV1 TaxID=2908892 RepID=UPI001F33012C|nr:hypothetical protein [Pseudoalteromonas sp. OFAV1]MCF2902259.1 hypothetical protein [Pseudoalteromonas sp. OFAV1]
MAINSLETEANYSTNFNATPSVHTPLFTKLKELNADETQAVNKKAAELIGNLLNIKPELTTASGFQKIEDELTKSQGVNLTDVEDLKIAALSIALITQQDTLTISKVIDAKEDKKNRFRGLSIDLGEPVTNELAEEIFNIANDINPSLEFTTHGNEVRFVNFDPSSNQDFIKGVKEVASLLPVEEVTMRRFLVEGVRVHNNYEVDNKGQDYLRQLIELGQEDLAMNAQEHKLELLNYIADKGYLNDLPTQQLEDKMTPFKFLKKEDQIAFDFN